jgi:hypothetical protein
MGSNSQASLDFRSLPSYLRASREKHCAQNQFGLQNIDTALLQTIVANRKQSDRKSEIDRR